MSEKTFGDFFLSDMEDEPLDDEQVAPVQVAPVDVAPAAATQTAVWAPPPETAPAVQPPVEEAVGEPAPAEAPSYEAASAPAAESAEPATTVVPEAVAPPAGSREARLAAALDKLMTENHDIEASALVSLDGFTMASALPEGMHEDRVGAMSAAILGLGERAATELGRGSLSQVFIQGENGYVVLMAAGARAVLTALADSQAKLGLVLYDMQGVAEEIGEILT
jgi:hypothetical protein